MRSQNELMVFVMVAGGVLLPALWAVWRWRTGARHADPGARVVAVICLLGLGGAVLVGPWAWIPERYGAGFWIPFAAAAALFVADWVRERAARPPSSPRATETDPPKRGTIARP